MINSTNFYNLQNLQAESTRSHRKEEAKKRDMVGKADRSALAKQLTKPTGV